MSRKNEREGLVGAVRQKAIGFPDLANMERHGKREDASSQQRRVRALEPLVYGSLDLAEARRAHMEGVKQSGRSACIHALVQFPTGLLNGALEEHQRYMLAHAVEFLNDFHGGDAVFAARLDRDEKGRHVVDAFLLPRYEFRYKDGRTVKKASVSKFSKTEAKRRFGRDDRRSQGSALQDVFYEHLRDQMELDGVLPPERKKVTTRDRLEPEEHGLKKDRQRLQMNAQQLVRADRIARKRNKDQAAQNAAETKRLSEERATLRAKQKLLAEAQDEVRAERRALDSRAAKLDQRQARVKRDALTVRNVRIASGQGVSRALHKILEQGFESQDVR
jgi:hypothetical protein